MALTMPAVTEWSKPNGEPIASTHSPTRSFVESPSFTAGRSVASILSSARSLRASLPTTFAGEFAAVGQAHDDFVGAVDDVAVGEHVAVATTG